MLKRYALIGLMIGLAACSSPPQRLSPEALTRIKKVAVMSLVIGVLFLRKKYTRTIED